MTALAGLPVFPQAPSAKLQPITPVPASPSDRDITLRVVHLLAGPVLEAAAAGKLCTSMPCEPDSRRTFAPLEALARLLMGIAPWLELGPDNTAEGGLRQSLIPLAVDAVGHAVNPDSPGFANFQTGHQPLVDTAFLAQALLRARRQLWGNLGAADRERVAFVLRSMRRIKPGENNWLLFSAMVETALWELTGEADFAPIAYAVGRHLAWYKGDGVYGDGANFHWDYYNSFVIQPMLLEILEICSRRGHPLGAHLPLILARAQRYGAVLERLISPEGTFPIMGRSSCYRFGAFQVLSLLALGHQLPASLSPGAVRSGLTAVISRMIEAPGTFDDAGWLRLGAVGHQPALAEDYISTGSLYLCAAGLLHLGLPPGDEFWTAPAAPWTQRRIWSGQDVAADHAED